MSAPALKGFPYLFTAALMVLASPGQATDKTGAVYALDLNESIDNTAQKFSVAFSLKCTAAPGGSSLRAYVVTSADGRVWQIAAVSDIISTVSEIYQIVEPEYLLRYVAVIVDQTAAPTWYGNVQLCSNGDIKVIDASALSGLVTPNITLGTLPSDPDVTDKHGRGVVPIGQTTLAVTFNTPYLDTNYSLVATPGTNIGWWITSKATTGFTFNISVAQLAGVAFDWFARHD